MPNALEHLAQRRVLVIRAVHGRRHIGQANIAVAELFVRQQPQPPGPGHGMTLERVVLFFESVALSACPKLGFGPNRSARQKRVRRRRKVAGGRVRCPLIDEPHGVRVQHEVRVADHLGIVILQQPHRQVLVDGLEEHHQADQASKAIARRRHLIRRIRARLMAVGERRHPQLDVQMLRQCTQLGGLF